MEKRKITKIEYQLFLDSIVSRHPTIQVQIKGKIKVYFSDGYSAEIPIVWYDCPGIDEDEIEIPNKFEITNEEYLEIDKIIGDYDNGLRKSAKYLSNKISKLSIEGEIKENKNIII